MEASEMTMGMEVVFGKPRGVRRIGTVKKLNAKSARIFLVAEDGVDEEWIVPYSLIHPVGTDIAAVVPAVAVDGSYSAGDRIVFGRPRGERHYGVILKVNAKTLVVQSDDGRKWRVKPSFIINEEMVSPVTPVIIANDMAEAPEELAELTAV